MRKNKCSVFILPILILIFPTNVIAQELLNSVNNKGKSIITIAMGYQGENNSSVTSNRVKTEYIPIGEIWKDIQKYQNQIVTLRGRYQGWHGEGIEHPSITRSDWVIKDDTGSIYVTGKTELRLRPDEDIGMEIIVKGRVLMNREMVPYIHATELLKYKSADGDK